MKRIRTGSENAVSGSTNHDGVAGYRIGRCWLFRTADSDA
jgi:hypothetical protein